MARLSLTLLALAFLSLPAGYLRLCGAMRHAAIPHPPGLHFLFVFAAAGSFLLTIPLAGSVPGVLASIVAAGIAPVVILLSSCSLYRRHRDSRFHTVAFWSGLAYVALVMLLVTIMWALSS